MGFSGEATIYVYNWLTQSAYGHMWRAEGWQSADIGGQIAGQVVPGAAGITDPELAVGAINALRLAHGILGTPAVLVGATIAAQFAEIPAQQNIDLWKEQVNGLTAPFTPSFWYESFGGNDLTIIITSPYGAVSFGTRLHDGDFSVTRYGVRHGTDPNGDGHFHRWGEGGHYTNINTGASPSIVTFRGQYHLFFLEVDGSRIFHSTSSDGYSWSRVEYIGLDSSAAPCAVVYSGDQLHVFARDPNGNAHFDYCSTDGGVTFSNFGSVFQDGDEQASAAVLGDRLCMVVKDHEGSAVMFSTYIPSAGGWTPGNTTMGTSASPGLIAYGGFFHLFFRDGQPDHNGILHAYSEDGLNWIPADKNGLGPFYIGANCTNGPRPVIYKDKLKIVFRDGNGNGILCLSSDDGFHFAPEPPDWYLGMNCDENPSAASLNDYVCVMARDAGGNGVMSMVHDLA